MIHFEVRRTWRLLGRWASLLAILWLTAGIAGAHAVGESYVWITAEQDHFSGRVEINVDDLRQHLGVDVPESGDERMEVLKQHREQVLEYLRENFWIKAEGVELPIEYGAVGLLDIPKEKSVYAQYFYRTLPGEPHSVVTIRNSILVETSYTHRSLVCIEQNKRTGEEFWGEFALLVFGSHNPVQSLDFADIPTLMGGKQFIWQGVLHIWIGIDHILFIITLLLPAVLVETDGQWAPVAKFRSAFWNIIKIVTVFTLSHSITLSLAALGVVRIPSRIVESTIALSIVLVAILAMNPRWRSHTGQVIFGFGLFHGLGFASVMSELPFRMLNLVKLLMGFNIGVELGQIAIVACVFPILYALRKSPYYVPVVLRGGAMLTAMIGLYWFWERACGYG
jgi:hypothetical protein